MPSPWLQQPARPRHPPPISSSTATSRPATSPVGNITRPESTNNPWEIRENGSNYFASTGCVGVECIEGNSTQEAWLSQVLTTVVGETYTLTFDYSQIYPGDGSGGTPNELVVDFGSDQVADLVNLTNTNIITYSYTVTATTTATELQFLGRQDPSYDYLDNVSVTPASTVTPEPESLALFGTGIFALLGVARRKLQA